MERDIDAARQVIAVAAAPGRPPLQPLAPNLAVRAGMRARQSGRKVCLLDTTADSRLESFARMEVRSIAELSEGPFEPEEVERLLVHHAGWNLRLLRGVTEDDGRDRNDVTALTLEVLAILRKRFDYVFVATSILDLYSLSGRRLLADADHLCLEVPDNVATVLNIAMWLGTHDMRRRGPSLDDPQVGEPGLGFVFAPTGDGHLTATQARHELAGVSHLGTMPKPRDSRGLDPTTLVAAGPDPLVATALDTVLFAVTKDLAFKPKRNKWWRDY